MRSQRLLQRQKGQVIAICFIMHGTSPTHPALFNTLIEVATEHSLKFFIPKISEFIEVSM